MNIISFRKLISLTIVIVATLSFVFEINASEYKKNNYNMLWQVELDDLLNEEIYWTDCISLIQSWKFINYSEEVIEKYFYYAKLHNLKIIVYIGNNIVHDKNSCKINKKAEKFIKKYINNNRIYAWHIFDEPKEDDINIECQVDIYNYVKEIDPGTKIFLSTNISRKKDIKKYFNLKSFDFLDVHKYVNPDFGDKQIKQLKLVDKYLENKKPLIVTLRAFNKRPPNFKRKEMIDNSILNQIEGYTKIGVDIDGFGFYGWNLIRNEGITKNNMIEEQFKKALEYMRDRKMCEEKY